MPDTGPGRDEADSGDPHLLAAEVLTAPAGGDEAGDTLSGEASPRKFEPFASLNHTMNLVRRMASVLLGPEPRRGYPLEHYLSGTLATEQSFVDEAPGKDVIVLCTHSRYYPINLNIEEYPFRKRLAARLDPYMRCLIALQGANVVVGSDDVIEPSRRSDGLLLGREVVARLDLTGTELIGLISCRSAVFELTPDEDPADGGAVASLRQAFLLAGASEVLATSWDVPVPSGDPDHPTYEIVPTFFEGIADGQDGAKALQNAIVSVLKGGGAKPHFVDWASYSITRNY